MDQRHQSDAAGRVPADVKPRTIRLDDNTWKAAERIARERGMSSAAEYIRQTVIAALAWDRALEAVMKSGLDPDQLRDTEKLARAFQWIAEHPDE